jgi:adenylate cyclase, class 2
MANEVEIKFVVHDLQGLRERLGEIGFAEETLRTHEMNTLYDHLGRMRRRGEVLRIRKYGDKWTVTHKAKGSNGRHKVRIETETTASNGTSLEQIFHAMGFEPAFRYEKFRSEWSDGHGHVLIDETPIGNIGEIEGEPEWIDRVAAKLGVKQEDYVTKSYAELFQEWKKKNRSKANHMIFSDIGKI